MELLHVVWVSVLSIVVLFLITKLIGNKQLSQLNMFDYINGITIGSIAAEMATSLENDFLKPLIAMVIYGLFAVGISFLSSKSIAARRIFTGKSIILLEKGKLYKENLKKAKLDVNEFLVQCRVNGYFNLSDIEAAVLESNGKVSVLPKSEARPLTPRDMNLSPEREFLCINLIIDGKVLERNLKFAGKDLPWLQKQLKSQDIGNISDVLLAFYDQNGNVSVYKKNAHASSADLFE